MFSFVQLFVIMFQKSFFLDVNIIILDHLNQFFILLSFFSLQTESCSLLNILT